MYNVIEDNKKVCKCNCFRNCDCGHEILNAFNLFTNKIENSMKCVPQNLLKNIPDLCKFDELYICNQFWVGYHQDEWKYKPKRRIVICYGKFPIIIVDGPFKNLNKINNYIVQSTIGLIEYGDKRKNRAGFFAKFSGSEDIALVHDGNVKIVVITTSKPKGKAKNKSLKEDFLNYIEKCKCGEKVIRGNEEIPALIIAKLQIDKIEFLNNISNFINFVHEFKQKNELKYNGFIKSHKTIKLSKEKVSKFAEFSPEWQWILDNPEILPLFAELDQNN